MTRYITGIPTPDAGKYKNGDNGQQCQPTDRTLTVGNNEQGHHNGTYGTANVTANLKNTLRQTLGTA